MTERTSGEPQRDRPITEEYLRRLEAGELVPTPNELIAFEDHYEMTPVERRFTELLYRVENPGTRTDPGHHRKR